MWFRAVCFPPGTNTRHSGVPLAFSTTGRIASMPTTTRRGAADDYKMDGLVHVVSEAKSFDYHAWISGE